MKGATCPGATPSRTGGAGSEPRGRRRGRPGPPRLATSNALGTAFHACASLPGAEAAAGDPARLVRSDTAPEKHRAPPHALPPRAVAGTRPLRNAGPPRTATPGSGGAPEASTQSSVGATPTLREDHGASCPPCQPKGRTELTRQRGCQDASHRSVGGWFTRGLRASAAPEPRGGSVPAARYTSPDRGLPACQSGWNLPTRATAEAGGRHPRSGEPASQATQGGGAGWGSVAPTPRACVRRGTAVLPHLSHRADRCTHILDVTGCPLRKKHVPG